MSEMEDSDWFMGGPVFSIINQPGRSELNGGFDGLSGGMVRTGIGPIPIVSLSSMGNGRKTNVKTSFISSGSAFCTAINI